MASSNMGVVITGDVEDQRHNPKWFVEHKHMLRSNQEGKENQLGYCILKVPEHSRMPLQAFSPRGWRFGLHNRENLDSKGSEAIKIALALQYQLVGEKWDHFCDAIVNDPKAMLTCYGLQDGMNSWTGEQIKHILALDALFLATYIDMDFPEHMRRLWTHNMLSSQFGVNIVLREHFLVWMQNVHHNLCLVENQIPFVFIDKVVEYSTKFVASQANGGNVPFIDTLQYQQMSMKYAAMSVCNVFMNTSSEAFEIDNSSSSSETSHILGGAYKLICGSKGLSKRSEDSNAYIHVPSARKLEQSRIKIVGVDGPLCIMSYEKKCLSLPKMSIYDSTMFFIRNMAWYEYTSFLNCCCFIDYIFLICDLIQTPEDLDLLVKCGVIHNPCGKKGFEMWTSLEEGLVEIPSSQPHHDMKKAIVSRCDHKRYRLWSEFKIVFCSKPWVVLSTIAVVLVTVSTLVQTYISIIGSNQMKPKFP